jgi:hypothetical protein
MQAFKNSLLARLKKSLLANVCCSTIMLSFQEFLFVGAAQSAYNIFIFYLPTSKKAYKFICFCFKVNKKSIYGKQNNSFLIIFGNNISNLRRTQNTAMKDDIQPDRLGKYEDAQWQWKTVGKEICKTVMSMGDLHGIQMLCLISKFCSH